MVSCTSSYKLTKVKSQIVLKNLNNPPKTANYNMMHAGEMVTNKMGNAVNRV